MQRKTKRGRKPTSQQMRGQVFVGHEFTADMMDDLRQSVDSALEGSGLSAYYADRELLPAAQILLDKVIPRIHHSAFGIYDISNPEKANVFIELGAGLARGKTCIIICKRGTNIPSNLQGLDRIEYHSFRDLSNQLRVKMKPLWPRKPRL